LRAIPEEERKLIAQMSDIERKMVENLEAKMQAKNNDNNKDFSWWRFDDP